MSHFLRGPDPAAWITNVPAFDSLTVRDERTGTDVVLDGDPSGSFAHLFEGANVVALGAASEIAPDAALSPTFATTPTLAYSTYLGGRGMNVARAAALGPDGGIHVAGQTDASDFPLAPAAGALDDARAESQEWWTPGAHLVDPPRIQSVVILERFSDPARSERREAVAYNAATETIYDWQLGNGKGGATMSTRR